MPLTATPGGESWEESPGAQEGDGVCRSITGHDCVTNNPTTNERWQWSLGQNSRFPCLLQVTTTKPSKWRFYSNWKRTTWTTNSVLNKSWFLRFNRLQKVQPGAQNVKWPNLPCHDSGPSISRSHSRLIGSAERQKEGRAKWSQRALTPSLRLSSHQWRVWAILGWPVPLLGYCWNRFIQHRLTSTKDVTHVAAATWQNKKRFRKTSMWNNAIHI